jgi:hypothetical protein
MLNVIMPSAASKPFMLSVIMLNVIAHAQHNDIQPNNK